LHFSAEIKTMGRQSPLFLIALMADKPAALLPMIVCLDTFSTTNTLSAFSCNFCPLPCALSPMG
jgi:hypothetical protein